MPTVVREDNDNLTAVLKIQIDTADYKSQYRKELLKKGNNSRLKGFRKGKTPYSTLVKMFGKQLLPNLIMDMLQEQIDTHVKENNLKLLGSLLPNSEQKPVEYDHKNLQDFEFIFDIAYIPEFELKGLDKASTYQRHDIEVSDDDVFETVENIKKQAAANVEVTEDIEENDIIRLKVQELEGDDIKADGATGEFPMLVNTIVDEDIKAELLTKKQGDTIRLNIFKLEEAKTDNHTDFVRKNYLALPDDDPTVVGEEYEAVITEVKRLKETELNQELFDKVFGPGVVKSEEEMIAKIKESTKKAYEQQVNSLAFNDIQERLLELNEFELPIDFLERWFTSQKENKDKKFVAEDFSKGMKWTLIRNRMIERFELKVTKEDVEAEASNMMKQYMGYVEPTMLEQLLKNQDTVNKLAEDAINKKVTIVAINAVTIEDKTIALQDYQEIIKKLQEKNEAAAKAEATEEEE